MPTLVLGHPQTRRSFSLRFTPMEPTDSPTKWVNDHIRTYVESNGAKGHHWQGLPTLLLTTTGRKTGSPRRTALIYGEDAGRYLIVASNGGAAADPLWYRNLVASPTVTLQVGAAVFQAQATTASAAEKPALWDKMVQIFPTYAGYQKKAPREIPLVILTPM